MEKIADCGLMEGIRRKAQGKKSIEHGERQLAGGSGQRAAETQKTEDSSASLILSILTLKTTMLRLKKVPERCSVYQTVKEKFLKPAWSLEYDLGNRP